MEQVELVASSYLERNAASGFVGRLEILEGAIGRSPGPSLATRLGACVDGSCGTGVTHVISCGRLQSCVRPTRATARVAGHDEVRRQGPKHIIEL
jgi:hypothetical protein